mmetsp:Transcript_18925/g.28028  ORF Transcript_18925/g.28028 Transcript_18925/m.28028 type:complete len:389 (+) Transcript_18925:117-1283(+)
MIDDMSQTSSDDEKHKQNRTNISSAVTSRTRQLASLALSMVDGDDDSSSDDCFQDPRSEFQEFNFTDSHLNSLMTKSELYAAAARVATSDIEDGKEDNPSSSTTDVLRNSLQSKETSLATVPKKPAPLPGRSKSEGGPQVDIVARLPLSSTSDHSNGGNVNNPAPFRPHYEGSVTSGTRTRRLSLNMSKAMPHLVDMEELFSDDDSDDDGSSTTGDTEEDEIDHALFLMERAMIYNNERIANTDYIQDVIPRAAAADWDKKLAAKKTAATPKNKISKNTQMNNNNDDDASLGTLSTQRSTSAMSKPQSFRYQLKPFPGNQSSSNINKEGFGEPPLKKMKMKRYYILFGSIALVGIILTVVIILIIIKVIQSEAITESVKRKTTFLREA